MTAALGEYFGNRVGEIMDTLAKIEQLIQSTVLLVHVRSQDNAADRATHLDSTINDVDMQSEWQNGPTFLKDPPSEWPTGKIN